jgi:hypothetical protein
VIAGKQQRHTAIKLRGGGEGCRQRQVGSGAACGGGGGADGGIGVMR